MPETPFDRRPSAAVRAEVNVRARLHLDQAVAQAYEVELDRWARDDSAPFPDRDAIRTRLEDELLVLCRGLGTWAAGRPEQIFSRIDKEERRRRNGFHDEGGWWD